MPLALITGLVTFIVYSTEVRSTRVILEKQESNHIHQIKNTISHHFYMVVSDLMILVGQHELQRLLDGSEMEKKDLAGNFLSFSLRKGLYDQIRFLDGTGMEVLRVNYNNGDPYVVPDEQLQFKGRRYYFEETFRLARGEIYVSPFDLNIEHGKIELPLKPVIRFGTPVFDKDGHKKGIMLLNYLGEKLLNTLSRYSANVAGQFMLLNSDGYWLKGPRAVDEWAFMYKNRQARTFATTFPDAWKLISGAESGQFQNSQGLFTFVTIHPVKEALEGINSPDKTVAQRASHIAGEHDWKVVSYVSPAVISAIPQKIRNKFLSGYAFMILVLSVASFLLARASVRRKQAEEALIESEEKFRTISTTATDAIVLLDSNGNIMDWNYSAERIFGYSKEEAIGKEIHLLLTPREYHDAYKRGFQRFRGSGEGPVIGNISEFVALKRDGTKFPIEISTSAICIKGKWHAVGIIRDISVRKNEEEKLLRARSELAALYKVSSAVNSTIELDRLFNIILKTITSLDILTVEQKAGIFLVEGDRMKLVSHLGHPKIFLDMHKDMKLGNCLCGLAAQTGEIIISKNSDRDSNHCFRYPGMETHGHIILPLKVRDETVGVLYLYTHPDTDISEEKISTLKSIGDQIGIAIVNARLYEKTKNVSLHDSLTGLANRRYMDIELERSYDKAKRLKSELSLIVIDIDYFKKYNDKHGHLAGDEILVQVAKLIAIETRKIDLAVRYGGEEFLVILPGTEQAQAYEIAERIRKTVEKNTIVTISIGVASYDNSMKQKEDLIKKADSALYRAKQGGRNRVEASELVKVDT
jgi:diguanylate cyclase (GGDEF)-like protein/PAS domain S-box-containing protein